MGRGKLSMKLISNEKSRKMTFYKRKTSLFRKAYELSTLCDVRACVFVYGPNQNDQSPLQVHTWPPCQDDVNDMIASYKANCLYKRSRKAFGLLDFFSERKKKIENDMSKLRKNVAEARFLKWDERLDHLLEDQLRTLMVELDLKLEMTKRRIEMMAKKVEEGTSVESSQTGVNVNLRHKQVMTSDSKESYVGRSSMEKTQAMMPFPHQYHQLQTMVQSHQMGHEIENLCDQFLSEANGSSAQIDLSYGNNNYFQNHPNFYHDPANGMVMDNTQSHSRHYGLSLATQSVLSLSYMQMHLTNDRMMMACALNSQMTLPNDTFNTQVNGQFDYEIMNILLNLTTCNPLNSSKF